MKTNVFKAHGLLGIAGFCLFLATGANAAKPVQVKVVGQDDIIVDREAIQNAINTATNKDLVVKLRGTFQLDGTDIQITRSDLTIKGDKKGAILKGLIDGMGFPEPGPEIFLSGNRGFVMGRSGPVANIEIKDLTLTGMRTAIFADGFNDSLDSVTIKNNTIDNVLFGVTALELSDIEIKNNHIKDALSVGIHSFGAVSGAAIIGNAVSTADERPDPVPVQLGIFAGDTFTDVVVRNNTFQGGAVALILWGKATNVVVTMNCIRDGGTQGIPFLRAGGIWVGEELFFSPPLEGSGFEIENNSYANNTWSLLDVTPESRDIWLTTISEDNVILESQGTMVVDEGINNSVVFHGNGDPGFCD